MALDKHQPELQLTQEQIDRTISALKDVMMSELSKTRNNYQVVTNRISDFYSSNSWTSERLAGEIVSLLKDKTLASA
jgi:hypothetical protein